MVDPISTSTPVTVNFLCDDDGLPDFDPLDQVIITGSAGTWIPEPPIPFFNRQDQDIVWMSPALPGEYLLTATYWWSDGHSLHAKYIIRVNAP